MKMSTTQIAVIGAVVGLAVLAFVFRAQLSGLISRAAPGTTPDPDLGDVDGSPNGVVFGVIGEPSVEVRGY